MENENTTDIRILKTRRRVRVALIKLLKQKKFEEIDVKDICNESGISRGTFYKHFKDKYDLVYQYQLEIMKKAKQHISQIINNNPDQLFIQMLEFWNNEAELLLLLISNNGSPDIQNQVKKLLQRYMERYTFSLVFKNNFTNQEKYYFTIFLTNALFGIIQEWVNQGQQESPEELALILSKIMPSSLMKKSYT